jgi:hypothetical protein
MTIRRPVAESTVVQLLLIETFTHSGFHPVVAERSLSTAVSVEYWNNSLPVVKTGDFEFDIELLTSLVEARPVLRDKTDDIYKDKNETKRSMERALYLSSRRLRNSGRCKKTLLVSTAIYCWTQLIEIHTNLCVFFFYFMYSTVHIFNICQEGAPASARK